MLELRNLVKHYRVGKGKAIHAVDDVSMRAADGELVALYGPSGSGKTTLIEIIAGGERPDSGTVLVDELDIFALSDGEWDEYRLKTLGIIGSPDTLMPGATALENATLKLLLTNTRQKNAIVKPLMTRLGLGNRMGHRPEELSMGECQRVSIARALATEPSLILADEPTGNLDTALTKQVLELLREICVERNVTVLLATHDPRAASYADQVYKLRDGRLIQYQPDETLIPARPGRRDI